MIVQMLAVIVSIVFLADAPLMPSFEGTLPDSIVIPCAIAAGIGIVGNVFIFPISSSSEVLDGMGALLSPMPGFLDACLLGFKNPSLNMNTELLKSTKLKILMAYKMLEPATGFLPMDVSIGRWSASDLLTLQNSLRRVVISFIGLLEVHRAKEEQKEKDTEAYEISGKPNGDQSNTQLGQHQIGRATDFRSKSRHPDRDELMEKSLKALFDSSEKLIEACK